MTDSMRRARVERALICAVVALSPLLVLAAGQGVAHAGLHPGYSSVVNRQTQECLDVWWASTDHAADVGVARCWGGDNQQWKLEPLADGFHRVRVWHSDMCLDVAWRGMHDGADVVQASCVDGDNQQWRVVPTGHGHFQLQARHSGKCLDKDGWGDVVQWSCHSGWWQQWRLR